MARPTSGERELRAQGRRTQAKLLDAGMAVLAEKGYHAARVDDIVRAAEVSHGTFYLYFANKQELLRALAGLCADETSTVIAGLGSVGPGPEGHETVRAWLADFVAAYQRYGVVIRAWMEDTVADRELVALGTDTFAAVSASLVDRVRESNAPAGRDVDLAAAALLALIERYTYFVTSRGGVPEAAMLDTLAAIIHRGWFGGAAERRPNRARR